MPVEIENLTFPSSGWVHSQSLSFHQQKGICSPSAALFLPSAFQRTTRRWCLWVSKKETTHSLPGKRKKKEEGVVLSFKAASACSDSGAAYLRVRSEAHSCCAQRRRVACIHGVEEATSCSAALLLWFLFLLLSTWLNIWSCSSLRTGTPASLPPIPCQSRACGVYSLGLLGNSALLCVCVCYRSVLYMCYTCCVECIMHALCTRTCVSYVCTCGEHLHVLCMLCMWCVLCYLPDVCDVNMMCVTYVFKCIVCAVYVCTRVPCICVVCSACWVVSVMSMTHIGCFMCMMYRWCVVCKYLCVWHVLCMFVVCVWERDQECGMPFLCYLPVQGVL